MSGSTLTLNVGSSSVKFALFDGAAPVPRLRGAVGNLAGAPHLVIAGPGPLAERRWAEGTPLGAILHAIVDIAADKAGTQGLAAIGHRIVHRGPDHLGPARVTPAMMAELEALIPLDPLHMPQSLAALRSLAEAYSDVPQVACFDTAFHRTMPEVARAVAPPAALTGRDIRRDGFRGLSYDHIARHLSRTEPALASGRVVVAHLGSGASLCAMQGGVSVETTMGFSVLDGLVMATRCGRLDPVVILHLGRLGHTLPEIEDILYHRSGLLGVSGLSGDMAVLLASDAPGARAAVELFAYRAAAEVCVMASALGGIDALVFTGGIGEHAPAVRADICARLGWLGLKLDEGANEAGASAIGAVGSRVAVRRIPTDEEAIIARQTPELTRAEVMVDD